MQAVLRPRVHETRGTSLIEAIAEVAACRLSFVGQLGGSRKRNVVYGMLRSPVLWAFLERILPNIILIGHYYPFGDAEAALTPLRKIIDCGTSEQPDLEELCPLSPACQVRPE